MSQLLLGWPNGTLGILFASLAGLLIMLKAWRTKPWDIHDEHSYSEPSGRRFTTWAPVAIVIGMLVALMLGVGALDQSVSPIFAMVGDILGALLLPLCAAYLVKSRPRSDRRAGVDTANHPTNR